MAQVDALIRREVGRDAREISALDAQARLLFNEIKPLGWRAAPSLGEAAQDKGRPPKARLFAVIFLSKLNDPASFKPLSTVLRDAEQDPEVRLAAAQSLSALDSPPAATRSIFCSVLGQTGLPLPIQEELLIGLTRIGCPDESASVLERTARAYGPRPESADRHRVTRALSVLGRSRGIESIRVLLRLIRYFPIASEPRAAAISALGQRSIDIDRRIMIEALPVVREAMRSETQSITSLLQMIPIAQSFGPQGDELLLPLVTHPDAEVVACAAEGAAKRKLVKALPSLESIVGGALNDPRFAPQKARPDPAQLLARIEAAVESLRRTRSTQK
jgi:HEAT repeat protein